MKIKGKVFTAQEVQSILNGSKVMFRQVVAKRTWLGEFLETAEGGSLANVEEYVKDFCPYKVGQKIFCKESFGFEANGYGEFFVYKSDNPAAIYAKTTLSKEVPVKWKPARNMKQEHSRLTPLIKEIKAERLQDITQEEAAKHGINGKSCNLCSESGNGGRDCAFPSWKENFIYLWNKAHKKPEEKFEANPWVWVVSFEVINN